MNGSTEAPIGVSAHVTDAPRKENRAMLTVHHLATSQSDRIVWLCEELGIAYELKRYERDSVTRLAPSEYQSLHSIGTAPIITDGDFVLGESAAIIDYIIHQYGQGRLSIASGEPAYVDYLFWFHFANGSFMPAAMMGLVAGMAAAGGSAAVNALTQRLDRAWEMVEGRLGESPFLAGADFTAADIITLFPLTTMRLFAPRDIAGYPNIAAYLQRIGERDAFKRAMAKADPGFVVPLT
jgi:glutathione S-transferase